MEKYRELVDHLYRDHGLTRGHYGVVAMPWTTHRASHRDGTALPRQHDEKDLGPLKEEQSSHATSG